MSPTVTNALVVIVSFVIVFGVVRTSVHLRARRRLKLARQQALLRQSAMAAKPESKNRNKRRRLAQLAEKAEKTAQVGDAAK